MNPIQNVRMGEIILAHPPGSLRTLLGSCIGVAVRDEAAPPAARLGLMAHILLAQSDIATRESIALGVPISPSADVCLPGKYVDTAVAELMRLVAKHTRRNSRWVADVAGGADMFDTRTQRTVGRLNIAAIDAALAKCGITIRSRDCGGTFGRRMTLDLVTGVVTVQRIERTDRVEVTESAK